MEECQNNSECSYITILILKEEVRWQRTQDLRQSEELCEEGHILFVRIHLAHHTVANQSALLTRAPVAPVRRLETCWFTLKEH